LAGDHFQLPPTVKSEEAARKGLNNTLFEKNITLHPPATVMLLEQYRMNNEIMGYPSLAFYQNKLFANLSVAGNRVFPGDIPLSFIDTAGCGFDEKLEGTSTTNPDEAVFLVRHLKMYTAQVLKEWPEIPFPTIAVISAYKEHINLLKEYITNDDQLGAYTRFISVNTIDSFQGQERDVVYISMTRSNPDSVIGFLSDVRRMNVAMTRARKKLVVIGDSATLSRLGFYTDFISYAEKMHAYQSAWEYLQE